MHICLRPKLNELAEYLTASYSFGNESDLVYHSGRLVREGEEHAVVPERLYCEDDEPCAIVTKVPYTVILVTGQTLNSKMNTAELNYPVLVEKDINKKEMVVSAGTKLEAESSSPSITNKE